MHDPPEAIDSRDVFQRRLTDLIDAAERGGVEVEGGYDVEIVRSEMRYDVEVSEAVPSYD